MIMVLMSEFLDSGPEGDEVLHVEQRGEFPWEGRGRFFNHKALTLS